MRQYIALFCIGIIAVTCQAANFTNAIQGVGPLGMHRPYLCLQNPDTNTILSLAPDQTADISLAIGSSDFAMAHLRFEGCNLNNEDLGSITFNIHSNLITKYTSPKGRHISYINANITDQGKIMGNIVYTPIQANFNLIPPKSRQPFHFAGVNLSGLEFGHTILPSTIPNLSQEDSETRYSDLKDIQTFLQMGINTVRIPINWTYLQWNGPGRTIINQEYYSNYIKPLLETLTSAKVHVILDIHSNMHYAIYDQESHCPQHGYCHAGTLILDESAYVYVWGQLWQLIQQDVNINLDYLIFDLANAPLHVPDDKVFTIQVALIKQLRSHGFPGYIIVQGNAGSELCTWMTHQWIGQDGQTYSNASLFTRDNFYQAGITDLSKILIGVHQYFDTHYKESNLEAFSHYLENNQLRALIVDFGMNQDPTEFTQFMNYVQRNLADKTSFGFMGWVLWGAGHAWENDAVRVTPTSYIMRILDPYVATIS